MTKAFAVITSCAALLTWLPAGLAVEPSHDDLKQRAWLECAFTGGVLHQIGVTPGKPNAVIVTPKSDFEPVVKAFATFYPDRVVVEYIDRAGAPLRLKYVVNRKSMKISESSTLVKTGRVIYSADGACRSISDPYKGNRF
jgi:hypothetical protein